VSNTYSGEPLCSSLEIRLCCVGLFVATVSLFAPVTPLSPYWSELRCLSVSVRFSFRTIQRDIGYCALVQTQKALLHFHENICRFSIVDSDICSAKIPEITFFAFPWRHLSHSFVFVIVVDSKKEPNSLIL
jgi:hypothetical protein